MPARLGEQMLDDRERRAATELEAAVARATLLAEAGEQLSSLDQDEVLTKLAHLVVPRLADWCAVDLVSEDGSTHRLVVTQADPTLDDVAGALKEHHPDPDGPVGQVMRSREGRLITDITPERLADAFADPGELALMASLGLQSVLIVPLTARGRTLGALSMVTVGDRLYCPADLAMAASLAGRAALAVDNAALHEAVTFQAALLKAQNEATVDGILVVSPEGEMLSFNQRFVDLWPIPAEVVESRSDDDALASVLDKLVDPEGFLTRVHALYASRDDVARDELLLRDGRVFDRVGTALHADDGTYLGWAWHFRDVTEERRHAEALLRSGERFAALARTLQQSLLPPRLPDVPGIEVAARYAPADRGEVVGDFYDVFQASRGWGVVIGDVCGKGPEAATVTALARYTIRAAAMRTRVPSRVLATLNEALLSQRGDDEERFVTVVFASLRQVTAGVNVTLCSAGHLPPLLRRHDGKVRALTAPALPVGLFPELELQDVRVVLEPGDVLVLYTDGITEARHAGEEFGPERLATALEEAGGLDAAGICRHLEKTVDGFRDGAHHDDTAVLVLRVPPTGS